MPDGHNITAISVLVEIDGRVCLAPIEPAMAEMFVCMLSPFQPGERKAAELIPLPPEVVAKVREVGQALGLAIERCRKAAGQ